MKIEKLSDNQIRCTLTRADLAERQLQLSELAYGTEKARSLFHDMNSTRVFRNSHLFRGRMEILPVRDSRTNWKVLNLFLICLAKSKRRLMLHKVLPNRKIQSALHQNL